MSAAISPTRSIETLPPFRRSAVPLFVSRPEGGSEDDGVLLTVGSAQDAESSVLAVIDARTMVLVASAHVQSSIPLGFHGSFVRKEG